MDQGAHKPLISSIYHSYDHHLPQKIKDAVTLAIEEGGNAHGNIKVFFRADDIGVPSKNYNRMMGLFFKYRTPLCLAVVPAWMTRVRWEAMDEFHEKTDNLFCWHMHGYRHMNHETQGKKQEFGPARSSMALLNDLSKGHDRLGFIMGEKFTQVFTPPWNRCCPETLKILKQIGFKGISASHSSLSLTPVGLKAFPVHVDLHTRKEKQAKQGWQTLLAEFEQGMASRACGIMIHHMRMNPQAFVFLEYLLECLGRYKQIAIVTYKDLI